MTRNEFDGLMRLLNDAFGGGFGGQGGDTWFKILGKYPAESTRDAIWTIAETAKMKPRIADIIEAMGRGGTVGGGSEQIETNGCTFCGGSGWANLEVERGDYTLCRCICERGERLNYGFRRLTNEDIRTRYISVNGSVRMRNSLEERRELKITDMAIDEKIAWCKTGLARLRAGFGGLE